MLHGGGGIVRCWWSSGEEWGFMVGLDMQEEVLLPSVLHVLGVSFLVSVGTAVVLSRFSRV